MIVSEIVSTSSDCADGSTGTVNDGGIHCWKQHDVGLKQTTNKHVYGNIYFNDYNTNRHQNILVNDLVILQ